MNITNMDIRLIALDMDGTLLDSQKHLPEENRQVLRACIDKGIYIVPATGRIPDGIKDIVEALPGVRYSINTNGASIWDWEKQEEIDCCKMNWEKALEIIEVTKGFHVMYDPYIDGRGISEPRFMDHLSEYGVEGPVQLMVRNTRDIVDNIWDYVSKEKKDVEKVNFFFKDLSERAAVRQRLASVSDIIVSSSLYNNLEINAKGATKGAALKRMAERLGLRAEQTMAFGDGENDFTMIQAAGLGVAMQNGEEALKQMSDYVTCSNDENGVARAIKKLILHQE